MEPLRAARYRDGLLWRCQGLEPQVSPTRSHRTIIFSFFDVSVFLVERNVLCGFSDRCTFDWGCAVSLTEWVSVSVTSVGNFDPICTSLWDPHSSGSQQAQVLLGLLPIFARYIGSLRSSTLCESHPFRVLSVMLPVTVCVSVERANLLLGHTCFWANLVSTT